MPALRLSPALAAWAQLAADLVNTAPRATHPHEELRSAPDVTALLARCPEPPPAAAGADVEPMRALRPPLREAIEAGDLSSFAAAVNPLLGHTATGWALASAGGEWRLEPVTDATPTAWFGARAARGLAELALAYGVDRLHVCSAGDCLRAVVDVSRNGGRRYCSRTCATRTNVRRHRAAAR